MDRLFFHFAQMDKPPDPCSSSGHPPHPRPRLGSLGDPDMLLLPRPTSGLRGSDSPASSRRSRGRRPASGRLVAPMRSDARRSGRGRSRGSVRRRSRSRVRRRRRRSPRSRRLLLKLLLDELDLGSSLKLSYRDPSKSSSSRELALDLKLKLGPRPSVKLKGLMTCGLHSLY